MGCRGQFNGQWQPIQAGTDFRDGWGIRIGYLELGLDRRGSLNNDPDVFFS